MPTKATRYLVVCDECGKDVYLTRAQYASDETECPHCGSLDLTELDPSDREEAAYYARMEYTDHEPDTYSDADLGL